ncbi:MAG: hypothetical protein JSW02_05040 [candidate division WOR-3 bacterium]|nr:MAG: hypothetical protein JSW02_05040 [candidate division WOR-3 bacterium]
MHGQEVNIRADVTGDRVYDDVRVGENYVLLVDKMACCKRTKRFVVDECDSLVDVTVDDYHRGIYGKEIAILQSSENGLFTDVYAYTKNRIEQVAFALPGRVERDEQGMVFCHEQYISDNIKMTVPCAVGENDLLLEKMSAEGERDTVIVAEPGNLRHFNFQIPSGSTRVLCATSDDPDITIILQDGNGDPVAVEYSNGQMTAVVNAEKNQDMELIIDYHGGQEKAHVFCFTRIYRKGE